jgi:hypothetical protein
MSMPRYFKTRRVWALAPLSVVLAGAIGCGTGKSYTHDGDPLLGNFNRPIAATPPPTGADIGNVWDGGPGIYPAPAIGNNQTPYIPGQLAPLPGVTQPTGGSTTTSLPGSSNTNAAMAGGPRGAKATITEYLSPDENTQASIPTRVGASIPLGNRFDQAAVQIQQSPTPPSEPLPPSADPNAVQIRQPRAIATSRGSAIVPEGGPLPLPNPNAPQTVRSLEEGQQVLNSHGIKWQRLERIESGDWQFTCAVSSNPNGTSAKQYSARHPDQLQAMQQVIEQVQRDR